MMHTIDSLAAELQRLRDRPSADAAPPVLSLFVIDVQGDAVEYERRLRSVISPAVRLGGTADFEQDSLPVDDIPGWFTAVSSQDLEQVPQFAREGCDRYAEHTGGGRPWELQDWLYRFDPDEDSAAGSGGTPHRSDRPASTCGWTVGGVLLRLPGSALGRLRGGRDPRRRPCGSQVRRVVGGAERLALRPASTSRKEDRRIRPGTGMRSNPRMREILRTTDVTGLSDRDIPLMFREVVERRWSLTAAGGRVLTDLRPEAPGTYVDRLAEETTINGRGMTDHDLPAAPDERTPLLVRRCLAYAFACLRKAQEEFGDTQVKAYVSLSFADTEEALLTSHVTFCTPLPDVRPYIPDLEAVTDAAVAEISLEGWEGLEGCAAGS